MVYGDRLIKLPKAKKLEDSDADEPSQKGTTEFMYGTTKTPAELLAASRLRKRLVSQDQAVRKAALREQELESLGSGGLTEIPCMTCPVFDVCEFDTGPVNVSNCEYFDPWFKKLEEQQGNGGEIL